jgi:hypothetical protein
VKARLVRARDSAVLMQDTVIYNALDKVGDPTHGVVTLPPNPNYQFKTFDALEGNPATAAEGLQTALGETAQTIAQLLQ